MKEEIKEENENSWKDKVIHGYYQGGIEKDDEITKRIQMHG